MLFIGVILILVGWLLGISILETLGIILAVVGLLLLLVQPGGRRYY